MKSFAHRHCKSLFITFLFWLTLVSVDSQPIQTKNISIKVDSLSSSQCGFDFNTYDSLKMFGNYLWIELKLSCTYDDFNTPFLKPINVHDNSVATEYTLKKRPNEKISFNIDASVYAKKLPEGLSPGDELFFVVFFESKKTYSTKHKINSQYFIDTFSVPIKVGNKFTENVLCNNITSEISHWRQLCDNFNIGILCIGSGNKSKYARETEKLMAHKDYPVSKKFDRFFWFWAFSVSTYSGPEVVVYTDAISTTLSNARVCHVCEGSGITIRPPWRESYQIQKPCECCGGSGTVQGGYPCGCCWGSGKSPFKETKEIYHPGGEIISCSACKGTGFETENRTLNYQNLYYSWYFSVENSTNAKVNIYDIETKSYIPFKENIFYKYCYTKENLPIQIIYNDLIHNILPISNYGYPLKTIKIDYAKDNGGLELNGK